MPIISRNHLSSASPRRSAKCTAALLCALFLASCAPTVKVEAPEKPIVINMNINISHEIRVKLDRELDGLITNKKGLF